MAVDLGIFYMMSSIVSDMQNARVIRLRGLHPDFKGKVESSRNV
jgi:hypothetical protein